MYDVIIMGAGISGISAAQQLLNKGITNILIIEAQDYVGGRIKTIEFDDKKRSNQHWRIIFIRHKCYIYQHKSNLNLLHKYKMEYQIETNTKPFSETNDNRNVLTLLRDHVQNNLNIKGYMIYTVIRICWYLTA